MITCEPTAVVDLRGMGETHAPGQNFFIFMQFSEKHGQIVFGAPSGVGASWEILDPHLNWHKYLN